ncbi:SHOCT domain-containing protein [Williamsia sp. D3]|uniref:SHOCT domain-containing protein n=1 Tax=Williamsia sp. D3 TaxID=1313067 RepID=UPI0003D2CE93|nr:SHOCT domain-containing protein [Williamsia sp. D3]ETD31557.1 hypothetical protein W823_20270 [Williamsia sp. D3]
MPGLLRGVARTAVIAGTATSVSNRVSRRQGQRWSQQAAQQQPSPYGQAPPPPPSVSTPTSTDRINALKEIADLKAQGVLTEDEFAAEKAKILAS